MKKKAKPQILKLKGQTAVFIDWANVYGWTSSLKRGVDPKKLFEYLKGYPEINSPNFYYGQDSHKKSKSFLKEIEKIGFRLTTKPVKYIIVGKVADTVIEKRKCDFDIEICMAVYKYLEEGYSSFIFLSGDGDFAPLYEYLIKLKKQVLVIYEKGHLGREVWGIKTGLFKTRLSYLGEF
ncbi:hypothetical protein COS81_03865 [candidate division WWE3 bacterium CG06_land_8_20_14_3_00_42_16]|uniref:NYN domain-containing protein n=4 Tax=Katanobacteria TaxID=422282 RepID=A0A2M7AM75_UNCKA|nr:MAG: hypothetical protein AUJ38_00105 [bacterium CG1_02_42_9]PIU68475.1 MAG: hypothetical protein COS81_03865 [candidate division WWE3 bacterium CG06_land_8_20_14_3_00_42_16]PIZ42940.1 MAG: hypothetical protein COY34_01895 [candidate division WWE3 bacterium CG_4_10_14_0_2_um_filter_42_8]PJA37291.1 MAG: hypothetical protein CO181_04135 [candidate division WWE3 bacterium CG_4_9_14_3_um_filter_43_9]PJC68091.1 MAG: hypothetical protein CO015_05295 [candidate division WWE3 bacterium CG_4_8_14_3_u